MHSRSSMYTKSISQLKKELHSPSISLVSITSTKNNGLFLQVRPPFYKRYAVASSSSKEGLDEKYSWSEMLRVS